MLHSKQDPNACINALEHREKTNSQRYWVLNSSHHIEFEFQPHALELSHCTEGARWAAWSFNPHTLHIPPTNCPITTTEKLKEIQLHVQQSIISLFQVKSQVKCATLQVWEGTLPSPSISVFSTKKGVLLAQNTISSAFALLDQNPNVVIPIGNKVNSYV